MQKREEDAFMVFTRCSCGLFLLDLLLGNQEQYAEVYKRFEKGDKDIQSFRCMDEHTRHCSDTSRCSSSVFSMSLSPRTAMSELKRFRTSFTG